MRIDKLYTNAGAWRKSINSNMLHFYNTKLMAAAVLAGIFLVGHPAAAAPPAAAISLRQFARTHGFHDLKIKGKYVALACRFHAFALEGDSRRATYNGTTIWLNHPVFKIRGEWAISRIDAEKTLLPLVFPHRGLTAVGRQVVVLDAGHGGHDQGANSPRQVEEKRVTLYLARMVRDILRRQGVRVRLTRERDRYLSLDERCALAERWDADLFISIHMNAATSREADGIETHILPPAGCPVTANSKVEARDRISYAGNRFDIANMRLGYALQRRMLKTAGAGDRGVRRSRFYVIRNVPCPAALVEGGFLSNPAEEQKIIQKAYRDKLAQGIAEGILNYLEDVQRAHRMIQ